MDIRYIDSPPAAGDFNMSCDFTLAVNSKPGDCPILRFYTWLKPTISLGVHQKRDDVDYQRCLQDDIDVVRRPTGGRAILHAGELTYSFIYPLEPGMGKRKQKEVYSKVHNALAEALRIGGFEVDLAGAGKPLNPSSPLCFATAIGSEIEFRGRKVVGSAQRVMENALLQHGSILLSPEHLELPKYLNTSEDNRRRLQKLLAGNSTHLNIADDYSFRGLLAQKFAESFAGKLINSEITVQEKSQIDRNRFRFIIKLN